MHVITHRQRRSVSLFPFLSILCCVIGLLTLILAGVTLGPSRDDQLEGQYVALTSEIHDLHDEADTVDGLIAQAVALAQMLDLARAEQHRLGRAIAEVDLEEAEVIEREAEAHRLRLALAQAQIDAAELEHPINERRAARSRLLADLESRDEAVSIRLPADDGAAHPMTPYFIECTEARLLADLAAVESAQLSIPTSQIASDQRIRKRLGVLKQDPQAVVVLLVRPGGVGTFEATRRLVIDLGLEHSTLPVPGHKLPDLSQFQSNA